MMTRAVVKIEPKGQVEHLRTRKPAEARLLTGEPIKVAETEDPRAKLADWMTSPDNPFFARAMANWVWAQFFGKGIADPPDAILMDVMMPAMDGPTTLLQMQNTPAIAHIPVILLTAKVQGVDQRRFASLGVAAVLFKPFDPLTLAEQMTAALGWDI